MFRFIVALRYFIAMLSIPLDIIETIFTEPDYRFSNVVLFLIRPQLDLRMIIIPIFSVQQSRTHRNFYNIFHQIKPARRSASNIVSYG